MYSSHECQDTPHVLEKNKNKFTPVHGRRHVATTSCPQLPPQKPSAIVFLTQCRLHGLRTSLLAWLRCLNPLRSSVVRYTSSGISAFDGVGRAPARHAARGHGGWPGLRDRARTLEYAARATRDESWRSVRFGSRRPAVATRERVLSRSVLTVLSSLRRERSRQVRGICARRAPSTLSVR